jgi:phenylpropionate dioxygenase-like ring-hydroxylating dioxygenase large terminal subunit
MPSAKRLSHFNRAEFLPKGWFWLLNSKELNTGSAKAVHFAGHDLAVFRGEDGQVRALEAYCPHMGAHLGDGLVQGNSLRCLFHNWQFNGEGQCTAIPTQKQTAHVRRLKSFKCEEKYGLVWIWTGEPEETETIPVPPELRGMEVASARGTPFTKNCHPNVVMINAIDANHFNTVHNLIVDLNMQSESAGAHAIRFHNTTHVPEEKWLGRFISRFYAGALTYDMTYWYGHTGSVTLGPDFLHFYILFALRPGANGTTEGQTILVTKKRAGFFGKLMNGVLLRLTRVVGNYFAKGDTIIFSKIKFNLETPTRADRAILEFIQHYEAQPAATCFLEKPVARVRELEV